MLIVFPFSSFDSLGHAGPAFSSTRRKAAQRGRLEWNIKGNVGIPAFIFRRRLGARVTGSGVGYVPEGEHREYASKDTQARNEFKDPGDERLPSPPS